MSRERDYSAEYRARQERAREAGFAGYSEQRQAARLGYRSDSSGYRGARQLARTLGTRVAPATVSVVSLAGRAFVAPSGVTVAGRDVSRDLGTALSDQIRAGNAGDRIYLPGTTGRGISADYALAILEDLDGDYDSFMERFDPEKSA